MYEIESNPIDIKEFFGELALKGNFAKAKSFYLIMDHCTHIFRLFVFRREEKSTYYRISFVKWMEFKCNYLSSKIKMRALIGILQCDSYGILLSRISNHFVKSTFSLMNFRVIWFHEIFFIWKRTFASPYCDLP